MRTSQKNSGLFIRMSEEQASSVRRAAAEAGYSTSDYIRHKLQLDRPRENTTGRRIMMARRKFGNGKNINFYASAQVQELLKLIKECNPQMTTSSIIQAGLQKAYASFVSTELYPDE